MRSPFHQVLNKYQTLIVKMDSDMMPKGGEKPLIWATDKFEMLIDVEVVLSLMCLIPLLNDHYLTKCSQSQDVFICNFLHAMRMC